MACCNECKKAQDAGTMPHGATCSPCAAGTCPPSNPTAVPNPKPQPQPVPQPQVPIRDCEVPTLRLDRVDAIVTSFWEHGKNHVEGITLRVLLELYPRTPDGRPIDWVSLTVDTATCLIELRRRVRARVTYVLAHHDEDAAQRRWMAIEAQR